ncbi:MAG: hypothetical protein JWP52_2813, partial [Rhizobacter sp.]|nr:hypothetical protein [Rhizobacter sp.]
MELSDVNHARNAVVARIAPTFHGRLSELDRATAFIEGTPASPARCLWISGATGVGKSALVRETVHLLRAPNRLIGAGACDPVMPLLPLAAPLQALDAALNQLLQWSEPALSRVRDDVRTALGERCAVLTRMIPALERLLGPHSACEALPPDRSRARLFSALVALIGCLARPQHPMTLVFEDMHGADVATLDLMQALLLEGKSASLSLIATVNMDAMAAEGSAFARTAGIASGSAHRWIDRLEAATGSLLRMPLHNLAPTDSLALLNELLSASTTDRDGVMAAIHQCTQGNPCHNVELVTALRFSGALRHPDAQAAPALPPRFTGSLKRLFSVRMAALGKARRRMLHLAAHLGETFDTDSLRAVSAADDESFAASLAQLQNLGMIVPAALVNIDGALPIRQLAFCHAGLREAARRPWALSRSQWVHLHIARRLSTFWPHPRTMRDTLVLATHHARGSALLMETAKADRTAPFSDTESTAPRANAATTERQAVAASLRHAVHQACEAAGMDAAASFLEAARKLRPAHAWSTDFHDTFAGEAAWHALLYSLGRFDDADRAYETLQRRAPGPLFLVDATVLRMLSLTNRRRRSEAVALGLDLLTKLGAPLPVANPDSASRHAGIDQAARVEFDRFLHMARTLPLETLATAPAADH